MWVERRIKSTIVPIISKILASNGVNGEPVSTTSAMRIPGLLLFLCLLHCEILPAHVETPPSSSCHDAASSCAGSPGRVRGGGECGGVAADDGGGGMDADAGDVIRRFLDCATTEDAEEGDDHPFHIQGWRWHSMSLIRDARRLERLSRHLADLLAEWEGGDDDDDDDDDDFDDDDVESGLDALDRAANYVVNFNMAGLFRIQSGPFANFLRGHLCDGESLGRFCPKERRDAAAEAHAFRDLIDAIDHHRVGSEDAGRELYRSAKAASEPSESLRNRRRLLDDVARSSRRLVDHLTSMRDLQEAFVVPAVSRVIPPKAQKSFNGKVLLSLGLLESRLHLVGMHDAVWESGIEAEKDKFEEEIPYFARMMIERWRRTLYIPKAGALDYGLAMQ
jgi:hypothetical protein